MASRPKDVIDGIMAAHTKARGAIDEIVTSGEFMSMLIQELRREAPPFLAKFVTQRAFTLTRMSSPNMGWRLELHNHKDEGQLLAYWNFGIPHPFRIPKVGKAKLYFPALGIVREHAVHPAVPPDKFIYRAWHRVLNRYTMRIKREIERSFRRG
jgi:hypothetical protein